MIDWKKYIITFFITASIFAGTFWIKSYFDDQRFLQMKGITETISTDILSSETQFDLISELSCREVGSEKLSQQISELARKIEFIGENVGRESAEVIQLKKFYALLEVKDYILMKRINDRCKKKIMFIFYFYGNDLDCKDCIETGKTLTELAMKYPQLRIYSFDYNLELSVIDTIISIFEIQKPLPAIVIGDKVVNGTQSLEDLESILREAYPTEMSAIDAEKRAEEEKKQKEKEENELLESMKNTDTATPTEKENNKKTENKTVEKDEKKTAPKKSVTDAS